MHNDKKSPGLRSLSRFYWEKKEGEIGMIETN